MLEFEVNSERELEDPKVGQLNSENDELSTKRLMRESMVNTSRVTLGEENAELPFSLKFHPKTPAQVSHNTNATVRLNSAKSQNRNQTSFASNKSTEPQTFLTSTVISPTSGGSFNEKLLAMNRKKTTAVVRNMTVHTKPKIA